MKPRVALACLALAAVAAGCRAKATPRAAASVPVTVATAGLRDVPRRLDAVGTVEPLETVSVKTQVTGPIMAVRFREGAIVRPGDVLFQIDPRPFQAALDQALAILARDRAQADNATAQARRADSLFAEGILSTDQHDQALAQAEESRAAVAADEAAVVNARLNLEYTDVRSPINGRTGSLLVQVGNMVKSVDGATLVVINRVDPVYVTFSVPEQRLAEVRAAQGTGALAVEAVIPGDSGQAPVGKLSFVDNTVDRQTGTIRLKATFANADGRLWPGQFVTTRLILGVRAGVVVVPAAAVQTGQKGSYVFVVKPDQTVEQRPVVADTASETEAVVQQGVSAGETVVTDGQLRLVPGAR